MDAYSKMFTTPEEMIERISKERGVPVRVEYNAEKKLWAVLVPKGQLWFYVGGTEDRSLLGCTTRAWQMWMNRKRVNN